MGQRASDTRGITFEDVLVPKEVSQATRSLHLRLLFHVPGCLATFTGVF